MSELPSQEKQLLVFSSAWDKLVSEVRGLPSLPRRSDSKTPQLLGKSKVWSFFDHDVARWRMDSFGWADGGYLLLPASLGTLVVSYQRPVVMHSFPNSPSTQQSLCGVPSPLLTVWGVLLLPADLCVFLKTSAARHVSVEVQVYAGDERSSNCSISSVHPPRQYVVCPDPLCSAFYCWDAVKKAVRKVRLLPRKQPCKNGTFLLNPPAPIVPQSELMW